MEGVTPKIINYGGWTQMSTNPEIGGIYPVGNYYSPEYSMVMSYPDMILFISNTLDNRINAPYDIWVRYTK